MASSIECIALDLDGTLLEPGAVILPEVVATLTGFVQQGGRVVIATGRTYSNIIGLLERNGILPRLTFPHAIISNERDLHLREADAFVPVEPRNSALTASESRLLGRARQVLASAEEELRARGLETAPANRELEERRGFAERRFADTEQAEIAKGVVSALIPQGLPMFVFSNNHLISLRYVHATKGRVLHELCQQHWDLTPRSVLAIGDAHNDLDMLDGTWGFACGTVANASTDIRSVVEARGGGIASTERGRGVAELVTRLVS